MTSESEAAQDEPPRGPPAGVKVTPIPPPTIPYSFAAPAQPQASSSSPTPPAVAAAVATATTAASPTPPPAAAAAAAASPSPAAPTPTAPLNPPSSIPQKRALADEDHTPAVRSPLHHESRSSPKPTAQDDLPNVAVREKRTKKDSLKKRESKAALAGSEGSRSTPEPKRKDAITAATTAASTTTNTTTAAANGTPAAASVGATSNGGSSAVPKVSESLPVRVRLAGPLRPTDFDPPASPIFRSHHNVQVASGQDIEFFELFSEQPINRRGYVYESAIADPRFPHSHYFRQTEPKPHYAHFSFEDAPPSMFFDQSALHLQGEGGFRTTRANVAARQGRWYWECKITRGILKEGDEQGEGGEGQGQQQEKTGGGAAATGGEPAARGHVRVGWARREASRDAPVGYDAYGYGIRDRRGQKVHMSRPKEFLKDGADLREGDVVGLEIQLPSEALHRKVVAGTYNPAVDLLDEGDSSEVAHDVGAADDGPNIVRDRIPFRFQTTKPVFEKFDYSPIKELEDLANPAPTLSASSAGAVEPPNPHHPVPCLRTLPGSCIRVYKNGVLQGTPFTHLLAFLPPASTTNGKLQEGARERLDDGTLGYYPAVSTFRGGAVEVNFGPHFWYPPPDLQQQQEQQQQEEENSANNNNNGLGSSDEDVMMVEVGDEPAVEEAKEAKEGEGEAEPAADSLSASTTKYKPVPLNKLRPVGERYAEQIAEDIVYDLVEEVYFWMVDAEADGLFANGGSSAGAATAGSGGGTATAVAAAAAAEGNHDSAKETAMDEVSG